MLEPMSELIYVSAFMDVADRPALGSSDLEGYVANFIKMAETGIPAGPNGPFSRMEIVLYICPLYHSIFGHRLAAHPNVECIIATTAETWTHRTFQESTCRLPTGRSPEKDSLGYITLQHSKIEWVANALYHRPTATHAAWIDFRLPHVFKSPADSLAQLKALPGSEWLNGPLYIPGCHAPKPFVVEQLEHPHWRFCGGFFLGSRHSLMDFWTKTLTYLPTWLNSYSVASWEVNFWAWLESAHGWTPTWYSADHNDSIVKIHVPPQAITAGYTPTPLTLQPVPGMNPMNTSYVNYRGLHLLNVRHVNYRIDAQGTYNMTDLKTSNMAVILDTSCCPFLCQPMATDFNIPSYPTNIQGLEDIRLFTWGDRLCALGTQRQWSADGRNRMLLASYEPSTGKIKEPLLLKSPIDAACEKNWIPIPRTRSAEQSSPLDIIYRWNPYSVGHLDPQGNLLIHILKEYPALHGLKGSAVPVLYRDALWTLVHRSEGRNYIHSFVLLDPNTLLPKAKTQEFVFESAGIEYCIGFTIEMNGVNAVSGSPMASTIEMNGVNAVSGSPMASTIENDNIGAGADALFWYTVQDRDPRSVRLPLSLFKPMPISFQA